MQGDAHPGNREETKMTKIRLYSVICAPETKWGKWEWIGTAAAAALAALLGGPWIVGVM
jgi:hypothetical protein